MHFVGHLARQPLQRMIAACDAFVHPNPREPFGIGPLAAMAAGVAVVVPDAGGVLTYATAANAWLARPDAPGLAAAVVRCLDAPDAREQKIAAGRMTARAYTWPVAAARMFDQYDRAHRGEVWPSVYSDVTVA